MLIFNNKEYDIVTGITLAELIKIMGSNNVINNKVALLATVNNKLIPPTEIDRVIIEEGDVIVTRIMPFGG